MRPLTLLLCPLFLSGCVSLSSPREYHYDIDLQNTTPHPVSVEFLRIESGTVGKTRCDLASGGSYINSFTTYNSAEYLEARLRYLDQPENAPRWITELPKGTTQTNIVDKDGRLTLINRPPH